MQTNLDGLFKTNSNLEKDGIWYDVGPCSFLIRRFGGSNASKVKQAMAKYYKPHARKFETDSIDPEESSKIMAKVFVESCLVTWKGVTDTNGEEIPYSAEKAVALFTSLPELFNVLFTGTQDYQSFKEELGNS